MRQFKVHAHSHTLDENHCPSFALKDLEMSAKIVKCRKACQCAICKFTMSKGDNALKTVQFVKSRGRFYYYAYCTDCFRIIGKEGS